VAEPPPQLSCCTRGGAGGALWQLRQPCTSRGASQLGAAAELESDPAWQATLLQRLLAASKLAGKLASARPAGWTLTRPSRCPGATGVVGTVWQVSQAIGLVSSESR